eukprot:8210473-Pyramimonas_sp.AAC.1
MPREVPPLLPTPRAPAAAAGATPRLLPFLLGLSLGSGSMQLSFPRPPASPRTHVHELQGGRLPTCGFRA